MQGLHLNSVQAFSLCVCMGGYMFIDFLGKITPSSTLRLHLALCREITLGKLVRPWWKLGMKLGLAHARQMTSPLYYCSGSHSLFFFFFFRNKI